MLHNYNYLYTSKNPDRNSSSRVQEIEPLIEVGTQQRGRDRSKKAPHKGRYTQQKSSATSNRKYAAD
jgi:hypothetical protein